MLPAELPLSLARVVVPSPPAMAQENRRAIDTHQGRTPHVMVPSLMSNALVAHSVHTNPLTHGTPTALALAQDQAGNAAVAGAAMRLMPVFAPKMPGHPGR
jgi:hypothetical protein